VAHTDEIREIAGVRLQLLRGGEGPPLIFLHGPFRGGRWAPHYEDLARHYTVLAPAHPGFGRSEDPGWIESVEDMAFYYLDFLEELGLDRVNLVGVSFGGWIAAELASICCHRLRRLVLMAPSGIRLPDVQRPDLFALGPEEALRLLYKHPERGVMPFPLNPTGEEREILERQQQMLARVARDPYFENPRLLRRLRRIRVPTLLIWGAEDRVLPLPYATAYRDAIPGASLVVIPDSGHVPAVDQRETFVRAVMGFFAGAPAGGE